MKRLRRIYAAIIKLINLAIFAFFISVGIVVFFGLNNFLESAIWQDMLQSGLDRFAFVEHLDLAVDFMGAFFVVAWGLRFWEQAFPGAKFTYWWSLKAKGPFNIFHFFTMSLVHLDFAHLLGNTRPVLLFMGLAILLLPTLQTFILATAVLLLVHGFGVWIKGRKANHLGASGLMLGYCSFDIFYSMFVLRNWWGILLALLLIVFLRKFIYYNVFKIPPGTSVAGHRYGFLGGIIAAAVIARLIL